MFPPHSPYPLLPGFSLIINSFLTLDSQCLNQSLHDEGVKKSFAPIKNFPFANLQFFTDKSILSLQTILCKMLQVNDGLKSL